MRKPPTNRVFRWTERYHRYDDNAQVIRIKIKKYVYSGSSGLLHSDDMPSYESFVDSHRAGVEWRIDGYIFSYFVEGGE